MQASLSPDPGSRVGWVCSLESEHYLSNELLRDTDWSGKRALGASPKQPLLGEVVDRPKLGFWAPSPSYRAGAHGLASDGWAKEVLRRQRLHAVHSAAAAAGAG